MIRNLILSASASLQKVYSLGAYKYMAVSGDRRIFTSTDGLSFSQKATLSETTQCLRVQFINGVVFILCNGGVYASADKVNFSFRPIAQKTFSSALYAFGKYFFSQQMGLTTLQLIF